MKFNLDVNPKLSWMPALDGLRGIAVIAVMMFHTPGRAWFPGGSLGVDLFFVLSGFLITTLLLQEHVATGRISLRGFYVRRARRLLPAVVALLAIYTVVVAIVPTAVAPSPEVASLLSTWAAVATYTVNIKLMSGVGVAPGLDHLWSLSVEEQFYLIWPAMLVLCMKLRVVPLHLLIGTGALVALSASLPLVTEGSYVRFYFGTDFRAQELLTGAFLAQLYVSGVLNRALVTNRVFQAAVCVAAGLLALWLLAMTSRTGFLFGGYYALVAVSCALVVGYAALANPVVLTNRALCYVGQRSYALYLWHMPINRWLRDLDVIPQLIAVFVLSFVAAELSYRLVESRFTTKRRKAAVVEHATSVVAPAQAA